MQHPVGYEQTADGAFHLTSFWALFLNPWAIVQYMHTMGGAFVTGSFAVAALGAFFVFSKKNVDFGKMFLRTGVIAAAISEAFGCSFLRAIGRRKWLPNISR